MSQVFHMVVSSNRKGQNFPPKQERFQQHGLDKFTSTALYESNHGLQAYREEYWPELLKQRPNIQKLHPEDYPLRNLKTYESSDFLTNYTLNSLNTSNRRWIWVSVDIYGHLLHPFTEVALGHPWALRPWISNLAKHHALISSGKHTEKLVVSYKTSSVILIHKLLYSYWYNMILSISLRHHGYNAYKIMRNEIHMFLGSLESFVGRRAAKWQVHGIHGTSANARALCWKNLKMGSSWNFCKISTWGIMRAHLTMLC